MTRRSYGARLLTHSKLESSSKYTSIKYVPRNLLDDLPDKGGPLAQVALGPRHAGLDDSGLGFLIDFDTLAHRVLSQ